MKQNVRGGFSLMEALIYIAIFAVSAVFLVSILTVVTRVQLKQSSSREVDQQIAFANNTIRDFVQRSSLVEMDEIGVPTTTLRLRTASSSSDRVLVYASSSILYLEEKPYNNETHTYGTSRVTPLTDSTTKVDSFYVTKYENPGGFSVVQIDLALSANNANTQSQVTRTLQTAVTRISAATFDSSINPDNSKQRDLGSNGLFWKDGYLSGTLQVGETGTQTGTLQVGDAIKISGSAGNFSTSRAGSGIIMKSPGGTCYLLSITNGGGVTTTAQSCL